MPRSRAGRSRRRGWPRNCWRGRSWCRVMTQSDETGLDWPALMRAGFQDLGLCPERFWRLTPAELRLMLGQRAGTPPMTRDGLDALLALYPDKLPDLGTVAAEGGDDDGT